MCVCVCVIWNKRHFKWETSSLSLVENSEILENNSDKCYIIHLAAYKNIIQMSRYGVVVNILDFDIVVNEFEPEFCRYVYFRTNSLK